jgi:membrane protease YdiL (CAAX protease family)
VRSKREGQAVRGVLRTRGPQLTVFFALAFGISWAIWIGLAAAGLGIGTPAGAVLNVLAIAGPSIAALVLSIALGQGQLRSLLARFSLSRVSGRWLTIALGLPLAMMVIALAASVAVLGAPRPNLTVALLSVLLVEFVRILFLGGPLGEELGWRGFALPRLQQHQTALTSSVLLGLIWGLWHIPLYFVPGTGQYELLRTGASPAFAIGGFVGWTIGLSVLFTWLFNQTRGSLVVVIAFHTAVNLAAFLPAAVGSVGAAPMLNVLLTWVVALVVVIRYGRNTLSSTPRLPSHDG